jgi:hypothetical protein
VRQPFDARAGGADPEARAAVANVSRSDIVTAVSGFVPVGHPPAQ